MTEEKKVNEDAMTENETKQSADDEVTWTDIDELLAEANATHFVKVRFRGKFVKVGWKELSEDEISSKQINMTEFRTLEKTAQEKQLQDWLEADVLAKIAKAGEIKGCLNDNIVTREVWDKLPSRVRLALTMDILETREDFMRSFL